jgi:quinol monooxygenase YgiN
MKKPTGDVMSNLVLVVTVKVRPEYVEKLKPAMLENAAKSVQEATCYQFDVIVSQDDEHTFMFYEVYKDEQALADHRQTPHFLTYWNLMQELGDYVQRTAQLFNKLT